MTTELLINKHVFHHPDNARVREWDAKPLELPILHDPLQRKIKCEQMLMNLYTYLDECV